MNFVKETFTPPQLADNKRITWIDLAKGICIFLVVINHIYGFASQCVFLNQLRMPLYFVLSGLFFKDYGSFGNFFIKKTNKILIPFIFFYLVSITVGWMIHIAIYKDFINQPYPDYLIFFKSKTWFNHAIWFLLCLFEINIIYFIIQRIFKSKYAILVSCLSIGFIGAAFSYYEIGLPWHFDSAMTALPFFYFGSVIRNSFVLQDNTHIKGHALFAILAVCGLIVLPFYIPASFISFMNNEITGSYMLALIFSTASVVSLLLICKFIKWLPLFSYLGRYSIVVLCVHMIYMSVVGPLIKKCLPFALEIETIAIVLMCWCTIPLAIKYIPWFTAQKDLIRNDFSLFSAKA